MKFETVKIKDLPVPERLLTCKSAPSVPGPEATQKDFSAYTLLLYSAWHDCHTKLSKIKELEDSRKEKAPN